MLRQVEDIAATLDAAGVNVPSGYNFRCFCERRPGVILLEPAGEADVAPAKPGTAGTPATPHVLVAHRGANFMFWLSANSAEFEPGTQAALVSSVADLLAGAVQQEDGWPDPQLASDWERHAKPCAFLDTCDIAVWDACLAAGFLSQHDHEPTPPAQMHWFTGTPRLSSEIHHACRLGRGQELWDKLRQGVHYDPEGHYIRAILDAQPSFVCELDGQPVSWSTVHLNGSMGFIYTPPEHRRHGYARSLAAFQIDHQLRAHGFACAHVVEGNDASAALLASLGSQLAPRRISWRTIQWPD